MAVRSCSAILHEAKTQMNLKNAVNVHFWLFAVCISRADDAQDCCRWKAAESKLSACVTN